MKQKLKCLISESKRREARIFPELLGTEVGGQVGTKELQEMRWSCEDRAGIQGVNVKASALLPSSEVKLI